MFKVSATKSGPAVVSGNFPSLPFKITKKFGCLGVVYIKVNVDIPDLGVFVDLLSEVELFSKLFPFLGGVVTFSMKSAYNDFTCGSVVPLD